MQQFHLMYYAQRINKYTRGIIYSLQKKKYILKYETYSMKERRDLNRDSLHFGASNMEANVLFGRSGLLTLYLMDY